MSVKELKESGLLCTRSEEKVIVEHEGKQYVFFAKELGYLDTTRIAVAQQAGENVYATMIAASIHDEQGKRFTSDEIGALHPSVAEQFLVAVLNVNQSLNKGTSEKK